MVELQNQKKIIITGGHPAPAISVLDYLIENNQEIDILYIGKKYNYAKEKSFSFEFKEVVERSIKFESLNSGRSSNIFSLKFFLEIYLFILALLQSSFILLKYKPQVVLTFGGFIGFPVSLAAFLQRIPIVMHEQTISPGYANRIISFLAKKICISFPETARFFNDSKIVITGNPIRKEVFNKNNKNQLFKFDNNLPVIYVTGGSLGAHAVNVLIEKNLETLLKSVNIIHQVGNVLEFGDLERLKQIKQSLDENLKLRYFPVDHIATSDIGYVYSLADMIISRSGANTFFEIISLEKPAIIIPLPNSAKDEQQKHAEILRDAGVASILKQEEPAEKLLQLIDETLSHLESTKANFAKIKGRYQEKAEVSIVKELLQFCS